MVAHDDLDDTCPTSDRLPLFAPGHLVCSLGLPPFAMSLRNVEDPLAARGVVVSYEAIRVWIERFGPQMAAQDRRDRL